MIERLWAVQAEDETGWYTAYEGGGRAIFSKKREAEDFKRSWKADCAGVQGTVTKFRVVELKVVRQ